MSFAKNMGKNIGKNISKNLSSIYSQKLLDHAKRVIQITTEATSDFIGNTKGLKSPQIFCNRLIQKQLKMNMLNT